MNIEDRLSGIVHKLYDKVDYCIGYPVCQSSNMSGFGEWYAKTGLCDLATNNVGNPFDEEQLLLNTSAIEKEVIEQLGPLYGIPKEKVWGFVTNSGTDGNMHGIYFGAKMLQRKTGMLPIVYVSDEAHYSSCRICDVQNLDMRLIKHDKLGRMDPDSFRENLDPSRPALIVFAIGSTFMGATDDQVVINKIIDEVKPIAVYKHLDAALFGGYFPFTDFKDIVNMEKQKFDSIAISGHKFLGIDEPCGVFLSKKEVIEAQKGFKVAYLNSEMPLISCSRSAVAPLKFYWILNHVGHDNFVKQAEMMLENTEYLQQKLDEIKYPAWHMPYSNTVFFKRPAEWIRQKYSLANGYIPEFGGNLSHIVVMQHAKKRIIDEFVSDLLKQDTENNSF